MFNKYLILLTFRWLGIIFAAAGLAWLCLFNVQAPIRGTFVTIPKMASCVALSAIAASICKSVWHPIPAPFLAGIVGAFGIADRLFGLFGGLMGFLIGLL